MIPPCLVAESWEAGGGGGVELVSTLYFPKDHEMKKL